MRKKSQTRSWRGAGGTVAGAGCGGRRQRLPSPHLTQGKHGITDTAQQAHATDGANALAAATLRQRLASRLRQPPPLPPLAGEVKTTVDDDDPEAFTLAGLGGRRAQAPSLAAARARMRERQRRAEMALMQAGGGEGAGRPGGLRLRAGWGRRQLVRWQPPAGPASWPAVVGHVGHNRRRRRRRCGYGRHRSGRLL